MNTAVESAIGCIWERYQEPLSLADIARSAILSRFHFSRIFKDATGVSPGRFLSAVRIYQAKRMLLTTSMNVTDISFAVGYNSLGSFTNHFTDSVGVSPGRFRRIAENGGFEPPVSEPDARRPDGALTGTIKLPEGYQNARVYLGAFRTPIMQGQPISAAVMEVVSAGDPCPFRLGKVPEGKWYIRAIAVADSADPEPWTRRALLVGGHDSESDHETSAAIQLRPRCSTDLPVLLALPDLETDSEQLAPPEALPAHRAAAAAVGRVAS